VTTQTEQIQMGYLSHISKGHYLQLHMQQI